MTFQSSPGGIRSTATFPEQATMFYCIGAQKAGTTWLFQNLAAHHDVHVPQAKEVHYFDIETGQNRLSYEIRLKALRQMVDTLEAQGNSPKKQTLDRLENLVSLLSIHGADDKSDHARYIRYLCRGYAGQKLIADITPAYAILPEQKFSEMAGIGKAKFLFIMRDPVSRMWSQIRMAVTSKLGGCVSSAEYQSACVAHAESLIDSGRMRRIERADYVRTLRRLEASVPKTRFKSVFYENLFTQQGLNEVYDFLGIERCEFIEAKRVNSGAIAQLPTGLEELMRLVLSEQYAGIRKRFGDQIPSEWK